MPWKNGLGVTTELYRIANPKNDEDFFFRISVAYVQVTGPFSIFPEVDRHLTLLNGPGMTLTFPDQVIQLTDLRTVLSFPGEAAVDCALLSGPNTDFNVMVHRSYGEARVSVIIEAHRMKAKNGFRTFVYVPQEHLLHQLEEGEILERANCILVELLETGKDNGQRSS